MSFDINIVVAKLENHYDVTRSQLGEILPADIRSVEVRSAAVNLHQTHLCASADIIERLGLLPQGSRHVRVDGNHVTQCAFEPVRLTVQDRDCVCDVIESTDTRSFVIGSLALLDLDLVVDSVNQRLIGNPTHGGERMSEEYLLKVKSC